MKTFIGAFILSFTICMLFGFVGAAIFLVGALFGLVVAE